MTDFDVIIVGGGIAGASLGAEIAGRRRSLIIEAESDCGYHSTGRSAAFYLESYGGAQVAQLSKASHDFLDSPPVSFSERGFLRTRGDLHITRDDLPELPPAVEARVVERVELERLIPGIRPEWRRALFEPGCADIDVALLHAAYLRHFKRSGGTVRCDTRLTSASPRYGAWLVQLEDGSTLSAPILVDAAGAWADLVAAACGVIPLGISPKRRTMVQLRVGRSGLKDLPLIDDAKGTFYFKGESETTVWLSPHEGAGAACPPGTEGGRGARDDRPRRQPTQLHAGKPVPMAGTQSVDQPVGLYGRGRVRDFRSGHCCS